MLSDMETPEHDVGSGDEVEIVESGGLQTYLNGKFGPHELRPVLQKAKQKGTSDYWGKLEIVDLPDRVGMVGLKCTLPYVIKSSQQQTPLGWHIRIS